MDGQPLQLRELLRDLVDELLNGDAPGEALAALRRMVDDYAFDEAGEALVRAPGAVEALLNHVTDAAHRETAVSILASCVRADPEECGPAARGELAEPLVDVFIDHVTALHRHGRHHENATLALLAVAECPRWALSEEDDDDDDEYTWGEDGLPRRKRRRSDEDAAEADANFGAYVAAPLAAVLKCGDGDARRDALQTLASIRLESGPERPHIDYPGRSAGRCDCSPRVGRLVEAGVVEPLAAVLLRGHGPTEPDPEDEEDWDETVLFALAAQCCTRLLAEAKAAFAPLAAAGAATPLANAVVAFATVEDDDMEVFVHACDAASALFAHAATTSMVLDARGCAVQQARDDDGVLQSFLDAGAVEACVAALDHPEREERRAAAVNLLSEFCSFGDGASRVVREANGVEKFVELLGEDPDDHTETAANDLFTATARVVEGLATDDGDRADALVAAGALRPLKRAVVDSVRYVYSDRIHTASNRRRETFLRAAIAANALGNVAEHSPPPPPPPRRKGKGRGGRRLPSRAMRVAADDEQERDGDKSFVEALVFVLRLAPPRYAQPPFREALAELKTSATWCLASLCAHDGPRQVVFDADAIPPLVALLVDAENDSRYIHDFAYPGLRHSFREYAAMALHRLARGVGGRAEGRRDAGRDQHAARVRRRRGPGHGRRGPHRALGARAERADADDPAEEVPAAGLTPLGLLEAP